MSKPTKPTFQVKLHYNLPPKQHKKISKQISKLLKKTQPKSDWIVTDEKVEILRLA
jgi:hypothetical protein